MKRFSHNHKAPKARKTHHAHDTRNTMQSMQRYNRKKMPGLSFRCRGAELPATMQCADLLTRTRHPTLARRTMHAIRGHLLQRYTRKKMPLVSLRCGGAAAATAMPALSRAMPAQTQCNDSLTRKRQAGNLAASVRLETLLQVAS